MINKKDRIVDIDDKIKDLLTNFEKIGVYYENKSIKKGNYYIIYEDEGMHNIKYVLYINEKYKKISLENIKQLIQEITNDINFKNIRIKIISFMGYEEDAYNNNYINLVLENEDYFNYLLTVNKYEFIDLLPHNHNVYKKVINELEVFDKTCVIQATGSGKSYLIAALIQKYKNKSKIIITSTKYIINQFNNKLNCNDEKTYFFTYSKLTKLIENDMYIFEKINPQIIILDEFHRAGAIEWSKGIKFLLDKFENAKILGTSATPIRFLDNKRDMSEELFNGNVSSEINLSEAIINGILPMPKYITAFYTIDNELNKTINLIKNKGGVNYEKAKIKYLFNSIKNINNNFCNLDIILKKHITTERNFIIFCQNEEHLEKMKKILFKCFKLAFPSKSINIYKVFSTYSRSKYELETFLKKENTCDEFNLLFCVDKINEGIHSKKIDGVILLRPTDSPIIFQQQIGRALQSMNLKKPLILDIVNNIYNITSKSFYQEIYDKYYNYKVKTEELGISLHDLDYYLDEIYDETNDIIELIKEFELCVGVGWDNMYKKLCLYVDKHGNADVKLSYEDNSLATWVSNQRQNFKNGLLSRDKIEKLEAINFKWDYLNEIWNEFYNELVVFKEKNNTWPNKGNCTNLSLIMWIDRQRSNYKKNILAEFQIQKLNEINFDFAPYENRWNVKYNELEQIWNEDKNLDRLNLKENHKLRTWLYTQRENIKKGILTTNQIERLKKIGFTEEHRDVKWLSMYKELKNYYETYNTKIIPVKYQNGRLKNWEKNQKKLYRLNKLSDFRKEKLDEIGFMK